MNNLTMNTTLSPSLVATSGFDFTWSALSKLIVASFSVLTDLINITVFVHPKLKDTSYKYMLAISITHFFYSLNALMLTITFSCTTCSLIGSFFAAFVLSYLTQFVPSILTLFRTFSECTIALYTYCVLTNRNRFVERVNSFKLVIFPAHSLIAVAIVSYQLFGISIGSSVDKNGNTQYSRIQNSFALTQLYSIVSIVTLSIWLSLVAFVLTFLNILNVIEFRKRYNTRISGLTNAYNTTMVNSIQHSMGYILIKII
jgi:hypothetical protein